MKRLISMLAMITLLVSWTSASESAEDAEPDLIALNFADGLENQDINLLMSAYH